MFNKSAQKYKCDMKIFVNNNNNIFILIIVQTHEYCPVG